MEENNVMQDNVAAAEAVNHGDHAITNQAHNSHPKALGFEDVLNSNIYVKEGSNVKFQSPKAYIEPFMEAVGAEIGEVAVATGRKISNIDPDNMKEHLSFGRIALEYNVGTDIPEFDSVVGMV